MLLAAALTAGAAAPALAQGGGWTTYRQGRVQVEHPAGWTVRAGAEDGAVSVTGRGGERATIWPVTTGGALDAGGAARTLTGLAQRTDPDLPWTAPQAAGPATLRTQARGRDATAAAALAWTRAGANSVGQAYIVRSPRGGPEVEATFARILSSFQVVGSPPAANAAAPGLPAMVRWTDPREQAFFLEVPQGWTVEGGMFRVAAVDVRQAVRARSPDGAITAFVGDAAVPPFAMPTETLTMTGFREGSQYSPGYGVTFTVSRYLPGVVFAENYGINGMRQFCAGAPAVRHRAERPDTVAAFNRIQQQYQGIVGTTLTAGEVALACPGRTGPLAGYVYAGTQATAMPGGAGGIWHLTYLYGFLAAEARAGEAAAILGHMAQTLQANPQWLAMQQGLTGNVSRIVTETGNYVSGIVSTTYWNQQRTYDEIARRRSNQILELVDTVDPATGETRKVSSGSNYYWIDHRGRVVGTEIAAAPNLDFRQLMRLP